ncbi:helix-turn-helix domain-containing protein [Ruminococcus sp.]|uniref:helix-turn-helix domain-containing protein n=1 Tax=Ruminococcus sp. TaxID=41978 RepID=UPI0025F7F601|nr:helix-turn-helix domain-containing protein [Ruminococcus sp.]MBR1432631.1 hypothetical protein [Ruminococcus sp.]
MRYTQNQIENAKNTDMILFLQAIEGFSFKRVGNEYHCIEHDSFVIKYDLHTWYWNSQGLRGRNAIDYCVNVRKMEFASAMQLLVGQPEEFVTKKKRYQRYKKAPVDDMGALNYVKISNRLLDYDLSAAELSVISYLATIHSSVISKNGKRWICVKQSTIAQKCAIKCVQTVGRVISSLLEKGLIERSARILKGDNKSGTTCYTLNLPDISSGYFQIDRRIFSGILSPKQMKVYLYVCRCVDTSIGYMWNSYNDLSALIGMKRSDVINVISELCKLHFISKQLVKMRDNRRVYADNRYAVVIFVAPHISRRNKKIETALASRSPSNEKISMLFTRVHCSTTVSVCQVARCENHIFSLSRGSPLNVKSLI